MWGLPCAMDRLLEVAGRHGLVVVEDACQGVGGGYRGRMLGSIGRAGAFSFNYYKNMTCGEGGAVVTDEEEVAARAGCAIDCCNFYWTGRDEGVRPFIANGARASEFEGALLNVQLDRIDGIIAALREQKQRILEGAADTGLEPAPCHSPEDECATHVMFRLPTPKQADRFAELAGGTVCARTGRHVYTEWDPVLARRGAHHPALDPYRLSANERCRTDYSQDMCARSLEILSRTVFLTTHPDRGPDEVQHMVETIRSAADAVLSERG
jgi:dTDP-4-amino-4,6-dideoxygalactose transaminase